MSKKTAKKALKALLKDGDRWYAQEHANSDAGFFIREETMMLLENVIENVIGEEQMTNIFKKHYKF